MEFSPDKPTEPAEPQSENDPAIPWGWLRATLFLFVWMVAQVGVGLALHFTLGGNDAVAHDNFSEAKRETYSQVGQLLVTLLFAFIFRRLIDRRSFKSLGFSLQSPFSSDLIRGLLLGLVLMLLMYCTLIFTNQISVEFIGFNPAAIAWLLVLMVVVGLNEEIAVRGYILKNLFDTFSRNRWVGLVLTAGLFSLLHLLNPNSSWAGLANIILAGLVLGLYYLHRGNLWFPIGLHFSWNFVQGPILGSPVSGKNVPSILAYSADGDELLTGGAFGLEASLLTTVSLLAALIWIHFTYRPRLESEAGLSASDSPPKDPTFPDRT